jgi:hypothetical protein
MDAVLVLLGLPLGAAAVYVAVRWPEWILLAALGLIAFEGTIEAYAGRQPYPLIQLLMGCFVAGRVIELVFGRRDRRLIIWPWLIPIAAYVVLTAFGALVAESLTLGWHGFKEAAWNMFVGLTAGMTLSDERSRRRLLRGVLVLAGLVGGYGVLRWITGPASAELAVASKPGRNFFVGDHIGLFGSFSGRDALARWSAFSIPVCIAFATLLRGRWRWVAMASALVCAVALFGSEVRSGAVAMVVASVFVLVLQQMAKAKRGLALGTTLGAILLAVGTGVAAYGVTIADDPGRADRFSNIFALEEDVAFGTRQSRWPEAIAIVDEHPFGLGLGTAGRAQAANPYVTPGTQNLDSSYLQVALEQGLPGLAIFLAGVVFLLGGITLRGLVTRDPERAAAAIGAAGTIVAWVIMMYTSYAIGGLVAVLVWSIVGVAVAGFTTVPQPTPQPRPLPYARPAVTAAGSGS